MIVEKNITLFWFRRDLRLEDNAALYYALKNNISVLPIFIFDTEILEKLPNKEDKRVQFIHETISNLKNELDKIGSSLLVEHGKPEDIFKKLTTQYSIKNVYANHDYEPYAIKRDSTIHQLLANKNILFHTFKDHVIFEKDEILKSDNTPYTIFTPYANRWKAKLTPFYIKSYPNKKYFSNFIKCAPFSLISIEDIGFKKIKTNILPPEINEKIIANYAEQRNFPARDGTSKLSVHLRFGTISIRKLAATANKLSEAWLNELIWRDFYFMILSHFPQVETQAFKPKYEKIKWINNEKDFENWCNGTTGYPIVDAGMRELNSTGFMHNRVRMIVASFLTKHLLIDWRWGEHYFAEKLNDFDLAANNGGWQWSASCGCDAAPYFRVFNPYEQTKRFDPQLKYIKKWVPEFEELTYSKPIVEHAFARQRVLDTYKKALRTE